MNIIPWEPWEELDRVRQQTERLWDEFLETITTHAESQVNFIPRADVVESPGDYRLFVAVPGFVEEDIEITVHDYGVNVRGERLPMYDSDVAQNHVCEMRYGFFERRFKLQQPIDKDTLRAKYDSGILTIVVGKAGTANASEAGKARS